MMANFLYNGLALPKIPTVDGYNYAAMHQTVTNEDNSVVSHAVLYLSTMPLRRVYLGGIDTSAYGSVIICEFENGDSDWTIGTSKTYDANRTVSSDNYIIRWSNYDVLWKSSISTINGTVAWYASIPIRLDSKLSVSVESAKEGMWLYNGYSLPPLPEYDPDEYPFVTIRKLTNITDLTVTLTLRKTWEQTVSEADSYDILRTKVGDVVYKIKKSSYPAPSIGSLTATDWGEPEVVTSESITYANWFIWTNKDIVSLGSYDYSEGETILAASEPGNVAAKFTCTNLNETDSVYKIAAWCYPKGTDFQTAPHTYTSAANFPGKNHSETWGLTGLTAGTEYDLYACIMVDGLATDHNALVSFTAEGTAELPDFTNTSLYVSDFDCTETTADVEIGWRNLPFIEHPNAVVYYISAELDDGTKQIVDLFYSDEQRGDGVHGFPTFEGLSPGTMYTMTARLLYSKTDDFSGYTDSGVYVTYDFTTPGKKDGHHRDSFLSGFASGLGDTVVVNPDVEWNSWTQGRIVGSALRKAL